MAKYGNYDWSTGVCGVYMLTCIHNGKRYIGSSCNIRNRITTHFGRDCKKYPDKPLYEDIKLYGFEGFALEVLIECDKSDLIGYEKLCYLELKPEYNIVIPMKCNFNNPIVMEKAKESMKKEEFKKHHKETHTTEEYREKMSEIKSHLKIPVDMLDLDGNYIRSFDGMRDAQRFLEKVTNFKGKNKVAKIREVCLGIRKTAFGYKWRFKK